MPYKKFVILGPMYFKLSKIKCLNVNKTVTDVRGTFLDI